MKLSKKALLGILVMVCFVVVVSGCTTNNNTSNSNSNMSSSNNSSSNTSSTNTTSANDVKVVVNYSGNWAADVSGNFPYRGLSGTGDQTTSLGEVTGPVTISGRKTEGGSGTLTVSITKGGKTLSTASTSSPWGAATAYISV